MIVGDLFSGIGGFSLAAHWMGWRTAWFSEVDPYACRVLAHHWPDVPNLGDIRAVDWSTVQPVDVLTGGFPCQPHSLAGQRKGSTDERDLFDEIIRCARVLRPRFLVLENVPGLFTSDAGRFFGRVLGALAACGYDAEWRVVAAADVGAPHKRERVWIIGWLADAERERLQGRHERRGVQGVGTPRHELARSRPEMEHADVKRRQERELPTVSNGSGRCELGSAKMGWRDAVPIRGADGTVRLIPREAAEGGPESPLWPVAHGVSGRVARLRGIGNSIVPQVAVEIFRRVEMIAQQNGLPMQEAA